MNYTFEAEFGDFKVVGLEVKVTQSPTEENEFHVLLFDPDCGVKDFFSSPPFPKGKASVKYYTKGPPHCPNCGYELHNMGLGNYELKERDQYDYTGVTVKVIPSYEEHIIELRLHYEAMEYKPCYPNEQNSIKS